MMGRALRVIGLITVVIPVAACSAVRCQWRDPALGADAEHAARMPKRLAIVGWASPSLGGAQKEPLDAQTSHVGDVLARVAADFIKLRRNYLVYDTSVVQRSFAEACRGKIEGVLMVRALNVQGPKDDSVHLDLSVEMYACRDGALVWRVEGAANSASHVSDLAQLTESYAATLGEPSRPFVAPAFSLLQNLFGALPDVDLNDEEVGEKIELGMVEIPKAMLADLHAL